ncbi:MAG: YhdH/YhfP family quinone oxidoreductase [Bacteroidota bacterium]
MSTTFRGFWVEETKNGTFTQSVQDLPFDVLPDHDVLIKVSYSSLNYKDSLSAFGNKGVTRTYPHIPGIDASGVIAEDTSGTFKPGQPVIVTGYELGSNSFGGFSEYIRVPVDWVVPLPDELSLKDAMIFGTAGFTAAYGVHRLQRELIEPESGPILVTGATGGVGSLAVFFLANAGYHVIAATGKMEAEPFLKELGASVVINRDEVTQVKPSLLLSGIYAGAIDTVGGSMLDAIIRQSQPDGAVACCGNLLGHQLNTNIYPFILRGVSLLGIDSAICKMPLRTVLWGFLAKQTPDRLPSGYANFISLDQLPYELERISAGGQTGRVVITLEQ